MSSDNKETAVQARIIADNAAPKVGFDPFTIITLLLPILSQLFQGCQKSAEAKPTLKETLDSHWDDATQTFDDSLIRRMRPHTRWANQKDGQHGHLKRDELDFISIEAAKQGRAAPEETVTAVMSEAQPVSA